MVTFRFMRGIFAVFLMFVAEVAYGQEPFVELEDSSGRSIGLGDPLVGTSWRNRPFHVGWMFGGLFGDDLIGGRIEQHEDMVGGYRVGWDFDHYWGVEGRFLFANLDFTDQMDPSVARTTRNHYWDIDVAYYPGGDSRWRPYASLGLGLADFQLRDANDAFLDKTLLQVPVGLGVKYFWQNWLALRLSATDNLAIGRGPFDTMHNVSLTGDVEIHFGGRRTSYFPW